MVGRCIAALCGGLGGDDMVALRRTGTRGCVTAPSPTQLGLKNSWQPPPPPPPNKALAMPPGAVGADIDCGRDCAIHTQPSTTRALARLRGRLHEVATYIEKWAYRGYGRTSNLLRTCCAPFVLWRKYVQSCWHEYISC